MSPICCACAPRTFIRRTRATAAIAARNQSHHAILIPGSRFSGLGMSWSAVTVVGHMLGSRGSLRAESRNSCGGWSPRFQQASQGGKVVLCRGKADMVYPVAVKLPPHAFPVTAGQFPVGHSNIRVGSVYHCKMAGFISTKNNFPDRRKILFQGVAEVKCDCLVFVGQCGQRLSKISIHKIRD